MGHAEATSTAGRLKSVASQLGRPLLRAAARRWAGGWSAYSRLSLVSDSATWVLDWERRELAAIAHQLGICTIDQRWLPYAQKQAVFYSSQFVLKVPTLLEQPHRIGFAYFHGLPGTGVPEFDQIYQQFCEIHPHIHRLQVSHSEMKDMVLNAGIASEKVFLIPIGINLNFFRQQTPESRRQARQRYGIPDSAVVVGSFQKDGVGWDEGMEPKLVKGPDLFLKTIAGLKPRIPELFVLLSGPARGYVKAGLERLGVPYRHHYLRHYPEVGELFQALDLYIIASRQEGGPKAVLESMASGVPLVTTRVGQAMDLVRHGENGWMVAGEDPEGLAHWAEYAIAHRASLDNILENGYQTAQANSYGSQLPLWRQFMEGFVEVP